jgi:pimeloyl-ACP methyl ester carboxylesterase
MALLLAFPVDSTGTPVTLTTPVGPLYGTLLVPEGVPTPCPVALIIAGSGPTDRNGNTGPSVTNNSLRFLAEGLAQRGIASLRYDRRGVGESRTTAPSEERLRFTDLVDDAAGWIALLRKDKRFSRAIVIGHSEGSLAGMMAAARPPVADAFVSIAGVGRPTADLLRDQLHRGNLGMLLPEALAELDTLAAGHHVAHVEPLLMPLFRPSVQDYLLSLFAIDPAKEIARLTMPILIASGTSDVQVPVAEGDILARAAPKARRLIITDMNHVLKSVPAGDPDKQLPAYTDPAMPVVPALIDGVGQFISANTSG